MGHNRDSCRSRQSRARSLLASQGLGGILFFDLKNIRYLTGFSGSDGALLLLADRTVLLVDGRYRTQAASQAEGAEVRLYEDKVAGLAEALSETAGLPVIDHGWKSWLWPAPQSGANHVPVGPDGASRPGTARVPRAKARD